MCNVVSAWVPKRSFSTPRLNKEIDLVTTFPPICVHINHLTFHFPLHDISEPTQQLLIKKSNIRIEFKIIDEKLKVEAAQGAPSWTCTGLGPWCLSLQFMSFTDYTDTLGEMSKGLYLMWGEILVLLKSMVVVSLISVRPGFHPWSFHIPYNILIFIKKSHNSPNSHGWVVNQSETHQLVCIAFDN